MLRKTLTILSLIGLLLSVGAWGASYLVVGHKGKGHTIALHEGGIDYTRDTYDDRVEPYWYLAGFRGFRMHWRLYFYARPGGDWGVFIPLWMPSGLFVVFLVMRFVPFARRRKRKKLGLCANCGYDLRASKDRCPECGEEFVSTNVER